MPSSDHDAKSDTRVGALASSARLRRYTRARARWPGRGRLSRIGVARRALPVVCLVCVLVAALWIGGRTGARTSGQAMSPRGTLARPSAPRRPPRAGGARSLARLGLRLGRPVFRGRPEWEVWELSGRGEAGTGVTTALEGVPVPGDSLVWMLAVVWILPAALHPKRTAVSIVGGRHRRNRGRS